MPRGGNGRKPTHLKIVEGTFRPGRAPKHEITPVPVLAATPPPGLDVYARRAWREDAPMLIRLGLLTEADLRAFRTLCLAASRYERAWTRLRRAYRKREDDEGIRRAEVSVERAEHGMRQLWDAFGMTPAARSRLDVSIPRDEAEMDEFEEFLRGPS